MNIIPHIHKHHTLAVTLLFFIVTALFGCTDEIQEIPDYTRIGEDVTLKLSIALPSMPKATRADLDLASLNSIESLWIRTYNARTGEATSEWFICPESSLPSDNIYTETTNTVTLNTKSGPSYIVAVANVENFGVTKDNITELKPLSVLLSSADTWEDYLNIAVESPWEQDDVRAPRPPLPMAGCYTDLIVGGSHPEPSRIDEWQEKTFQPYFIPAQRSQVEFKGAIHLRRLVSHLNFNIIPGDNNLNITVNSYQVFNAPKYSWLAERGSGSSWVTNFGDQASSKTNASSYYSNVPQYGVQNIETSEDGSSSFDFWLGENKHTGSSTTYTARELRSESDNTLFKSLTGDIWTTNNMASYVMISCSIDYSNPIWVDIDGKVVAEGTAGAELMQRTGECRYYIHLGYIGDGEEKEKSKDFNCFRNTDYTYNVHVNGVNDIRVDAQATDETFHGEEGVVVDLNSSTIDLDAHYGAFNIELKESDLLDSNFGFIIIAYENGEMTTVTDENLQTSNGTGKDIHAGTKESDPIINPKYYNWIELRPAPGEFTLAEYKPRFGPNADGKTFLLTDLYNKGGSISIRDLLADQGMLSDTGYYTVFINEYTYEPTYTGTDAYANETSVVNGNPAWMGYINQNPRRAYIRVSRDISPDGKSAYARSKYAISQQSMETFYSDQVNTPDRMAIALERITETDGMNLRHDFAGGNSINNGRWNTAQWLDNTTNGNNLSINNAVASNRPLWTKFIIPGEPLEVGAVGEDRAQGGPLIKGRTIAGKNPLPLPGLIKKGGAWFFNDPQGNSDYTIEAINSCLNRNRDNNGNGRIDPDELRWYVPAIDQYLMIMLGGTSLPQPMMDFVKVTQLPYVNTSTKQWASPENGGKIDNLFYSRYMFIASNNPSTTAGSGKNNLLWGMEGVSTSTYQMLQTWTGNSVRPWGIRCIRNLGTDMTRLTADFNVDRAFVREGNRFLMTYYDVASIRPNPTSGNGPEVGKMPIHTNTSPFNRVYYSFEASDIDIEIPAEYRPGTSDSEYQATLYLLHDYINSNPCSRAGLEGTRWRIPNQNELTIMRNSGILTGATQTKWLSCTVSYFNFLTGEGSSTLIDNRHFMGVTPNQGTILTAGNLREAYKSGNHFYIRCVRDRN